MATTRAALLPLLLLHLLPSPSHLQQPFPESQYNKGWAEFLEDETSQFHDLPLAWEQEGGVPAWIQGSYIKNGPARKEFGDDRYYSNLLDSWAKLHRFNFNDGKVTMSGRMIESANYNKSVEAGKMVPTISLAHVLPNDWSWFEMMEGAVNGYDNTNVLVWKLGPQDRNVGEYLAVTDYPTAHAIDPDTLAVKAKHDMNVIKDGMSLQSCAHWLREVGKDTSLNYHMVMNPLHPSKLDFKLYRFGSTWEEREVIGKFTMPHQSLVHMFARTKNYAIIPLYPVAMDFLGMMDHHMHPFETIHKVDGPTRFYLMDLNDGTVIDGFETDDPDMVFAVHFMNSWEEGDEVVFDLTINPWDALATFFDVEAMMKQNLTTDVAAMYEMKRIRLNINTKQVSVEDWPNARGIPLLNTIDFPMINQNYAGVKNRFAYGWVSIDYWRVTLVKKDLEDSLNDKTWSLDSHYPGEMFFIPRPGAEAEDDGVLVTVVFDGELKKSYLLLLDGQTFKEINRSYLPKFVPFSFHGNWFPELY